MEGYINFKKPQNEMFKKLDGKIQKIVDAHSNLNKLYALNDFPSYGGPKRPLELPPQLPPPPPWVPKGALSAGSELINQNSNSTSPDNNNLLTMSISPTLQASVIASSASQDHHNQNHSHDLTSLSPPSKSTPPPPNSSSSSSSSATTTTLSSAQFQLLAQKIKETLESDYAHKSQNKELSAEERRKFQENLIEVLKQQIAAVAKTNKFKFNTPPKPKNNMESRSLLLKSSPQTLFNTIRRETSLLLNNKRNLQQPSPRLGLSLLSQQQNLNRYQRNPADKISLNIRPLQQQSKFRQQQQQQDEQEQDGDKKVCYTIQVVVAPTESNSNTKTNNNININLANKKADNELQLNPKACAPLTYQVLRNKIKLFQQVNQIEFGKIQQSPDTSSQDLNSPKKKTAQKSIDNIVNRLLKAKCSPSPTNDDMDQTEKKPSFQEQIIKSSVSLLQASSMTPSTPIPIFRTPFISASTKGGYYHAGSRMVNLKSRKSKRSDLHGMKIGNYLDREQPQPTNDKITVDQFANCLNLVRKSDASLQKRQDQLLQAETKPRLPLSNRPIRLKRLRTGEKIHMPASASYKATRKAGLQ